MKERTRTTLIRILSAVIGLPLYVYMIVETSFRALPLLAASLVISIACLVEFYNISTRGPVKPFVKTGIAAAVLINILFYFYAFSQVPGYGKYVNNFDGRYFLALLSITISVIFFLQLFKRQLRGGIYSMSVTVMGLVYIVVFTAHILLMKALSFGHFYIIALNAVIMLNDTGAYFGGVYFGKHKVGFEVSPNKTWEGYFTGLLFSIIAMIVTNEIFISFFQVELFSMIEAAIVGAFLSVAGNGGDLIESAVKRDGEIKDSGTIIPGHGGMWDTFDAVIFSLPLFYYYLVLTGVR